ncbi:hypothetical protein [Thalassovita litoralis]|jgi:hypothetical protein|uniref:hypothetical protein n=1 Tax=Thalassovita litoralis TaxID=1010611 RepID=UPI00163DC6C2|nr:hypothetical protein [Thalassovita litoralis]
MIGRMGADTLSKNLGIDIRLSKNLNSKMSPKSAESDELLRIIKMKWAIAGMYYWIFRK